jgi:outer membrane protein TolC
MKLKIFLFGLLAFHSACFAQLSLQECRQKARNNYPMIKQYKLVEQSCDFNIDNASKGFLPQISLTGMALYHTDMLKKTQPALNMKNSLYGGMVQISQTVYDGGAIAEQKRLNMASANAEKEQINVTIYDVNARVDELFFGVLLIDEQLKQNELLRNDLSLSRKNIEGMMKNGIANQSDIDAIHVEQLNAEQSRKTLNIQRQAFLSMLGFFINQKIDNNTVFSRPEAENPSILQIERPELKQIDAQLSLLDEREKALNVNLKPKIGLFATGLLGNAGLDMMNKQALMAGVKLSWNIGSLYTRKNDRKLIDLSRQQWESNRETFLFNIHLQTENETSVINDLKEKLQTDDEIINLRTNIRNKAERKVENGTLTVNEMLRQINAESEAKQAKALHQIQLLKEIYQLKNICNYK